jgi:hypothetical protein
MLVDRSAARPSRSVRALAWAGGALGLGLIVLAVQQLLAEPAGADTPGVVDGVVSTVEEVVDPASAALEGVTSAAAGAPAAPEAPPAPALDPLDPVVEPLATAAEPLPPTVQAAAPVVEAVAPVAEAVAPVVTPVAEAVAPVVTPVAEAVGPAVATVVQTLPPVIEGLVPVVAPVVGPVVGAGTGPPPDRSDLATSSLDDALHPSPASTGRPSLPSGTRAAPLPASGALRLLGSEGSAPVPMLRSTGGDATGGGAASGVPPGPWALAVPSAMPGGLGGPASGGAGPSVLLAILAGGVPGLGLARGGVVHDRAARLIGLVRGPGRLPG